MRWSASRWCLERVIVLNYCCSDDQWIWFCAFWSLLIHLFISFRFNRRGKKQDRHVLEQGTAPPKPPVTAATSLPPPLQKPSNLPTKNKGDVHEFILPPNTAGTAKLKGRVKTKPPVPASTPSKQETVGSPMDQPSVQLPCQPLLFIPPTFSPTLQHQLSQYSYSFKVNQLHYCSHSLHQFYILPCYQGHPPNQIPPCQHHILPTDTTRGSNRKRKLGSSVESMKENHLYYVESAIKRDIPPIIPNITGMFFAIIQRHSLLTLGGTIWSRNMRGKRKNKYSC